MLKSEDPESDEGLDVIFSIEQLPGSTTKLDCKHRNCLQIERVCGATFLILVCL